MSQSLRMYKYNLKTNQDTNNLISFLKNKNSMILPRAFLSEFWIHKSALGMGRNWLTNLGWSRAPKLIFGEAAFPKPLPVRMGMDPKTQFWEAPELNPVPSKKARTNTKVVQWVHFPLSPSHSSLQPGESGWDRTACTLFPPTSKWGRGVKLMGLLA